MRRVIRVERYQGCNIDENRPRVYMKKKNKQLYTPSFCNCLKNTKLMSPDQGYSRNVPDEGYSRSASCALHLIYVLIIKIDVSIIKES
jgi:hypothetical protein